MVVKRGGGWDWKWGPSTSLDFGSKEGFHYSKVLCISNRELTYGPELPRITLKGIKDKRSVGQRPERGDF